MTKKQEREARAFMSKSIAEHARRLDALASEEERRSDPDWFIDEDYKEARMKLAEARRKADQAGKPTLKRSAKKGARKKRKYGGFLSKKK